MAVAGRVPAGYRQPQTNKQWLYEAFHSMQRCGWLIGVDMAARFVNVPVTPYTSFQPCGVLI